MSTILIDKTYYHCDLLQSSITISVPKNQAFSIKMQDISSIMIPGCNIIYYGVDNSGTYIKFTKCHELKKIGLINPKQYDYNFYSLYCQINYYLPEKEINENLR